VIAEFLVVTAVLAAVKAVPAEDTAPARAVSAVVAALLASN